MPEIYLVAVSIQEFQEMGMELTPEVGQALQVAVQTVKDLVESIKTGPVHS